MHCISNGNIKAKSQIKTPCLSQRVVHCDNRSFADSRLRPKTSEDFAFYTHLLANAVREDTHPPKISPHSWKMASVQICMTDIPVCPKTDTETALGTDKRTKLKWREMSPWAASAKESARFKKSRVTTLAEQGCFIWDIINQACRVIVQND